MWKCVTGKATGVNSFNCSLALLNCSGHSLWWSEGVRGEAGCEEWLAAAEEAMGQYAPAIPHKTKETIRKRETQTRGFFWQRFFIGRFIFWRYPKSTVRGILVFTEKKSKHNAIQMPMFILKAFVHWHSQRLKQCVAILPKEEGSSRLKTPHFFMRPDRERNPAWSKTVVWFLIMVNLNRQWSHLSINDDLTFEFELFSFARSGGTPGGYAKWELERRKLVSLHLICVRFKKSSRRTDEPIRR